MSYSKQDRVCGILKVQRDAINHYRNNPVVDDAVRKVRSVEDVYLELREVNKGISRFLPRKKDRKHNERVSALGDVVGFGNVIPFFKNGLLSLDNFAVPYSLLQAQVLVIPVIFNQKPSLSYYLAFSGAAFALSFYLSSKIRNESFSELEFCSNTQSRAIYVDKKIEELF